jgi:hypothetical protein
MRRTAFIPIFLVSFFVFSVILPAQEPKPSDGFIPIFNGKDLEGWDGNPQLWSVKDGAITGQTTAENPLKKNSFIAWRGGKVADFELRLQFRMEGGNTGIQYRSVDKGGWVINGYQADFDMSKKFAGILYEEGGRGILAKVGEKVTIGPDGKLSVTGQTGDPEEIRKAIRDNDWNEYAIVARGNRLQHIINGRTTMEAIDEQAEKRAMEGLLAFQVHVGPPMKIQFKDIRLKEFPPASAVATGVVVGTKPNFSGDWKMNPGKSDFGPVPAPSAMTMKISHQEPVLKVTRSQEGGFGSFTSEASYTTDGQECRNKIRESEAISIVKWENAVLITETKMDYQGGPLTIKARWSLSEDGKTLSLKQHYDSSMGEAAATILLEKQ